MFLTFFGCWWKEPDPDKTYASGSWSGAPKRYESYGSGSGRPVKQNVWVTVLCAPGTWGPWTARPGRSWSWAWWAPPTSIKREYTLYLPFQSFPNIKTHWLNTYGVRYPKFIWARCAQLFSFVETRTPPPPTFGLIYEGGLLVSQERRHLFVTPLIKTVI